MAKMQAKIRVQSNVDDLISRIEALSEHVEAAPVGDPVAELAREIGHIDLDTDTEMRTSWGSQEIRVDISARGNLAKLLEAYEAQAQ